MRKPTLQELLIERISHAFIRDATSSNDVGAFSFDKDRVISAVFGAVSGKDSWQRLDAYFELNVWQNEAGVLLFKLYSKTDRVELYSFEFDMNQEFKESLAA